MSIHGDSEQADVFVYLRYTRQIITRLRRQNRRCLLDREGRLGDLTEQGRQFLSGTFCLYTVTVFVNTWPLVPKFANLDGELDEPSMVSTLRQRPCNRAEALGHTLDQGNQSGI